MKKKFRGSKKYVIQYHLHVDIDDNIFACVFVVC